MKKSGFTLIETLVVVTIIVIISAIIFISYRPAINRYELDRVVQTTTSMLNKARSQAMYSKESSKYSVRLSATEATLFQGTSYSASDPDNEVFEFGDAVTLSTISLAGGGNTVTFNRIYGDTTQSGTLIFRLESATSTTKTVTIGKTGIIQVN